MIKAFTKGKPYTLTLQYKENIVNKNVIYDGHENDVLRFFNGNSSYSVDLKFNIVQNVVTSKTVNYDELYYNVTEEITYYVLRNIEKGWTEFGAD